MNPATPVAPPRRPDRIGGGRPCLRAGWRVRDASGRPPRGGAAWTAAAAAAARPALMVLALALATGMPASGVASPAPSPAATPSLSIGDLPAAPATPALRPRAALVVPAQVLRWRQEAAALEHGDGTVARDPLRAAALYCRAARHGDAEAQYSLAWMLTNARGIERDEAAAAHLFAAAAEQGHAQAVNMARSLGTPRGQPPTCLQPPADEAEAVAEAAPAAPAIPAPPATSRTATAPRAGTPPGPFVAPPRIPPNAPPPIVRFVELVAPDYQLEPHLVLAVMATESNFDPWAVSPKNARGLMQLIPDTARRFRVRDLSDPAENIRGGMAYLRWLLAYFEGDLRLALAAYNAGEGAVERYRGVPPFAETRLYVRKVLAQIGGQHRHPFDPQVTPPSSVLPLMRGGVAAR
jgi:soluble lytic murein transglycosylase-like protein